ncbi:DUF3623 domain-containing protein [Rhodobacteraceae bacterium CCMM004]|nr:DUF3623 domain-containing protein [Rhodobacteraceae bacterium CCMM004]
MLGSPWIAALGALFLWWFSTGAILCVVRYADRRGPSAHRLAVLAALPVLAAGLWAVAASLGRADAGGAWLGFLGALALWGWIELAFLTGVITGPNRRPAVAAAPEAHRFLSAWGTVAYHEILLVAALLALIAASGGAANDTALWTFAVLYAARVSAKLNLFYGVPRINTEFIPTPLAHLPSHFRIRRLNWLFPISILGLSALVFCWTERAMVTGEVSFALLAALSALALLEHWLMVVPLPDARLWRWMLPAHPTHDTTPAE